MSQEKRLKNDSNWVLLSDWLSEYHSEEELREVFLYMNKALKYIHEHNYCIEVFYPTCIQLLDDRADCIRFQRLVELPSDNSAKREMINEDIFNSALLQIGIYSNSLRYLKPEFLKENFDSFVQFIPSGDVPYYRGVIQRGASVYFNEFAIEKGNRDLAELEKQLEGTDSVGGNKPLVKASPNRIDVDSDNSKINDQIYPQINGLNDSAFVNVLLIPAIIISVFAILIAVCLMAGVI